MAFGAYGISKRFPGTQALSDVTVQVDDGSIHALLGANGSGKSTLVKVLTGVLRPDSGHLVVNGEPLPELPSPSVAVRHGIRVVHQTAPLIDSMSVLECIALFRGYPRTRVGFVSWRKARSIARETLGKVGLGHISTQALARELSGAQRALIALAIALRDDEAPAALLLDEATASLPDSEAEQFLEVVGSLARKGAPVLMVTHRLEEVRRFADEVTVLHEGKVVYSGPTTEITDDELISFMIEGTLGDLYALPVSPAAEAIRTDGRLSPRLQRLWATTPEKPVNIHLTESPALAVTELRTALLDDLSFTVGRGEVVGVVGLVQSGVAELPYVLAGVTTRRSGIICVGGIALPLPHNPRIALEKGLVLLPSDRLREGGIASLTVEENALLPDAHRYWSHGKSAQAATADLIDSLQVRPPEPFAQFRALSGGNQQKVILGKWLRLHPTFFILDDPTSGVDPGARRVIFQTVRTAAAVGVGFLVFSTEPQQLATVCDRVIVLKAGRPMRTLSGESLSGRAIMLQTFE